MMLFGLSVLMEILLDAIDGFTLHPLDAASTLPPLTNTKPKDGFPSSAALASKYFLVKNKNNSRGAPQALPSPPSPVHTGTATTMRRSTGHRPPFGG